MQTLVCTLMRLLVSSGDRGAGALALMPAAWKMLASYMLVSGAPSSSALDAAKARGVVLGKPENLPADAGKISGAKRKAEAIDAYSKVMNYICIMQKQGKTYEAIATQLNKDGYKTRTGKEFAAMTVYRMVQRVDCKKIRKAARAAKNK